MTRPRPWVDLTLPPVACNSSVHSVQIRSQIITKTISVQTSLLAATGLKNSRDCGGGGYSCGPEGDKAAVDALGGGWARLEVSAGRSEGQRKGRRGR